ncbi:uncharacterized protein LACBIDRAFT_296127 [Laccaria bicolor S238N-H82]|uniref:Predicted protein n=1 Tax=Laccaria bicolor (strain S238N-H82 / ATCC MYA-4686) TaxID=486041 RepID=B0E2W2_LACBS|nr:uncharacterized protein LACBIDRAFT_296127 [Laccaria bicolor S238N-H82]EDQ98820.1 predicted protein [Laccaria bicolor S238N-H82]|eukprot:XP_001890530.1 predicted protein [Laccaria bicolor S238N-H82]
MWRRRLGNVWKAAMIYRIWPNQRHLKRIWRTLICRGEPWRGGREVVRRGSDRTTKPATSTENEKRALGGTMSCPDSD